MTGGAEKAGTETTRIVEGGRSFAAEGARIFAAEAGRAVRARGRFDAAIPGGRTPRETFRLLASMPEPEVPWRAVHVFWTDERAVPPDHPRSNYRLAFEELLSRVPVPPRNVHRIHGEIPTGRAALAYEEEIGRHFGAGNRPRFDLVVLGVGEDGHTASLFPGSRTLEERHSLAAATFPPASPGDGRVTLTYPVLEGARAILFLGSGREKAEAIRRILGGGAERAECPAGRVRPDDGTVLWLLDREAASLLPPRRP